MPSTLCWPLGFKVHKMWFSVLTSKKGRWELTQKWIPCVRSFAHVTSGLSQTFWHWDKILPSVICSSRTFQHAGKAVDLTWSQEDQSKGITLSLWMYKGGREAPEQAGCNCGKLKSSHISVSHMYPEIHSSTPTPGLQRFSILHPKGNPKQACSFMLLYQFHGISLWEPLGLLGTHKDIMSRADWRFMKLPTA